MARHIDEETRKEILDEVHGIPMDCAAEENVERILDKIPVSNGIPLDGYVRVGDMTIEQLSMICSQNKACANCPLMDVCSDDFIVSKMEDVVDAKIDFSESEEIKRAKKILIECGIMTEDGEIAEAYKDIIVKKEK